MRVFPLVLAFVALAFDANSKQMTFYSEVAAPFYFFDKDGAAQGISVDIIDELKTRGVDVSLQRMPWARAYFEAKQNAYTGLTTVLRSPEREDDFIWLAEVYQARAKLYVLSGERRFELSSLEQAKTYRVATIRGYGSAEYLLSHGFKENQNLVLVANNDQLWSLLLSGRIDMVLSDSLTAKNTIDTLPAGHAPIEARFEVDSLNLSLFIAVNKTTPHTDIAPVMNALKVMHQEGTMQRILIKWGL